MNRNISYIYLFLFLKIFTFNVTSIADDTTRRIIILSLVDSVGTRQNENTNPSWIHSVSTSHNHSSFNMIKNARARSINRYSCLPSNPTSNPTDPDDSDKPPSVVYRQDFSSLNKVSKQDRIFFVSYSADDWKTYFEKAGAKLNNEYLFFKNHALFQFREYLKFLERFPSFEQRIVGLQKHIDECKSCNSRILKVENFPFNYIEEVYNRVESREIQKEANQNEKAWVETNDVSLKAVRIEPRNKYELIEDWQDQLNREADPEKRSNLQKRIDAAIQEEKTSSQEYILEATTVGILQNISIDTNNFTTFDGNQLQHQFHSEIINNVNYAANFYNKYNNPLSNLVFHLSDQAIETNKSSFHDMTVKFLDVFDSVKVFCTEVTSAFCKGGKEAVLDNGQRIMHALIHPIKASKNCVYGIGKSLFRVVNSFVNFALHPQPDEVYQKQFQDLCFSIREQYKNLPKNKVYEKIGYGAIDYIFFRYTKYARNSSIKKASEIFHKSKIGNQIARVAGLAIERGIKNLNEATDYILESYGIINFDNLRLPALYKRAFDCSKYAEIYKTQLIKNFKKYLVSPEFRKQYDKWLKEGYVVPIQIIPKDGKLNVIKQRNGNLKIVDAMGNIHNIVPKNPKASITKLSETGKKTFSENGLQKPNDIIPFETFRRNVNPPEVVKRREKVGHTKNNNYLPPSATKAITSFTPERMAFLNKHFQTDVPLNELIRFASDYPGANLASGVIGKIVRDDITCLTTVKGALYEVEKARDLAHKGEKIIDMGGSMRRIDSITKEFTGRNFEIDIMTSTKIIECKNVAWDKIKNLDKYLGKIRSTLGDLRQIAISHNKELEFHSKNPIHTELKEWLSKEGIKFVEDRNT